MLSRGLLRQIPLRSQQHVVGQQMALLEDHPSRISKSLESVYTRMSKILSKPADQVRTNHTRELKYLVSWVVVLAGRCMQHRVVRDMWDYIVGDSLTPSFDKWVDSLQTGGERLFTLDMDPYYREQLGDLISAVIELSFMTYDDRMIEATCETNTFYSDVIGMITDMGAPYQKSLSNQNAHAICINLLILKRRLEDIIIRYILIQHPGLRTGRQVAGSFKH